MSNLVPQAQASNALALRDDELLPVLQSSLYPGAKPESIKLVLGYCRAAGLDPMQKPVHLVPMSVKVPGSRDQYEWRDVVMPGIGLYRTQAARTGRLVGISEPEFGPVVEATLGGVKVRYPEWCRVTVYRLVEGEARPFTALEYWLENYATAKKDSDAPNSMWRRRVFGQLAKCAEAQALRKAFPEVGSQPTAEELEPGDEFVAEGVTVQAAAPAAPAPKVARRAPAAERTPAPPAPAPAGQQSLDEAMATEDRGTEAAAAARAATAPAAGGEAMAEPGELKFLQNKAASIGADLQQVLADMGGLVLDKLTKADFVTVKAKLRELEG